jgi:S1-C subfamily serine protease
MAFSKQQAAIVLALMGLGAGAGTATYYWLKPTLPDIKTIAQPAKSVEPALPVTKNSIADRLDFVTQVVDKVGPAVVKIATAEEVRNTNSESDSGSGSEDDASRPERPGTGSGFIITADGQIVTNAHVVGKAKTVKVTLRDGRVLVGQVLGRDALTDVALVKVAGQTDLPIVKMNGTEALIPGQWAIAIGNPLGLDNSTTLGIVSAIGRSSSQVGIPDVRSTFIQADVAINPGNSGGPLLNARGEAIGINTAIRRDAQGLAFAIPAKTAQRITQQLLATGQAQHPYLGIRMAEVKEGEAAGTGVLLAEVLPNTPAQKGGLQAGDRILKIAESAIKSPDELQEQVEESAIGKPLAVEIDRNGQKQTLNITPEAYPVISTQS